MVSDDCDLNLLDLFIEIIVPANVRASRRGNTDGTSVTLPNWA